LRVYSKLSCTAYSSLEIHCLFPHPIYTVWCVDGGKGIAEGDTFKTGGQKEICDSSFADSTIIIPFCT
jgi:transcriptional antiterminator Rof (Rho-off)